jgi:predicted lipoprotein with Yx(FWY)xxD motif
MKTPTIVGIIVAIIIVGLGAWYFFMRQPSTTTVTPADSTPSVVTTPAPSAYQYKAGNLLLGTDGTSKAKYLIGFNGMPLYTYDLDTATASACTGQCADDWPPYTVPDASALTNLQAGVTGVAATSPRADGTLQVTYGGKPLYFFTGDTASGPPTGDGVNSFSLARP